MPADYKGGYSIESAANIEISNFKSRIKKGGGMCSLEWTYSEIRYFRIDILECGERGKVTVFRKGSESQYIKEQEIRIISQPANFGGLRWYFLCPINNTKCKILLKFPNLDYFAHRSNFSITYCIQKYSKRDRNSYKGWSRYSKKIKALEKKINGWNGRKTYRGEPTKNFKKLINMYHEERKHLNTFFNTSKV